MDWRLPAPAALTALLLVTVVGGASGQENSDPEMPDSFKEAMPLLEQGISLGRKLLTRPSPVPTGDARRDRIRNAADERRRGETESLVQKSMAMYEVCLEKADPYLV